MATRSIVPRADGEGQLGTSTKRWSKAIMKDGFFYDATKGIRYNGTSSKWEYTNNGTDWVEIGSGSGSPITRATFTNASLSTGKLTITHSKALSAPYSVIVAIFDNNNKQIIPDEVTGATNTVEIDLTSYGTLTGTWGYAIIA